MRSRRPLCFWLPILTAISPLARYSARVEAALFSLYIFLSDADGNLAGPAAVTYNAIIHIDAKIKVIDALLQHRHDPDSPVLKTWTTLGNALGKRIKVRNKIAH